MADRALQIILSAFQTIPRHPYICRKARHEVLGTAWRELLIDFGSSGYIALFEIATATKINVVAVRHQRESDYH